MCKKDYTKGDGTAFPGMAGVDPDLRKLIQEASGASLPEEAWVNVNDFTLWEKTGKGGFYRVMIPRKIVKQMVAAYSSP